MECLASTSQCSIKLPNLINESYYNKQNLDNSKEQFNHFRLRKLSKNNMPTNRSPPTNCELESKQLDKNNLTFEKQFENYNSQESLNNYADNNFHSKNSNKNLNQLFKKKLTDQLWYHGFIKRIEAQRLLRHNGDFLVRESISSGPGRYVLSGLWENTNIHFEINESKSEEGDYSVSLFHFEDEKFRSIIDLIEFYLVHKKRITYSSGFILLNPIMKKPDLFNIISKNQQDIEVSYASYLNRYNDDFLNIKSNLINVVLPETYKTDGENLSFLSSKFTKELNNKENTLKTNEQEKNNKLKPVFHRVSLDLNNFNCQLPSPPHSPPPPTPIFLTKCNTIDLTNGKNNDLNDYCDIDYEALDKSLIAKEILLEKNLSEKTPFDSQSHLNLPWKNERRSEILDASTNSLNKLIFNQMQQVEHNNKQLQSSLNNSKSSGNLLSNDGITNDQRYEKFNSCFFTLNSKKMQLNEALKQNYSVKAKKISLSNDRAHSCHNLLIYKNASIHNENQRFQCEINKKKNFHQKVDNSMLSLQKVEPAPNLPIRHQSSSVLCGFYNINGNRVFKSEENKYEIETDYDSLSSIKLLNNISKDFSDYSEFANNNTSDSKITKKSDFISIDNKFNFIDQKQKKQKIDVSITKKNETNKKINNEIYSDITNFTKQKPPIILPKPLQVSIKKMANDSNQILEQFCDYLVTANLREIAFFITEEDYKTFCLKQEKFNSLIFMQQLTKENCEVRKILLERDQFLSAAVKLSVEYYLKININIIYKLIERWYKIAEILFHDLGNAFSFGTIIESLENVIKINSCILITEESIHLLQTSQLKIYNEIENNKYSSLIILPFIQPYIRLVSDSYISNGDEKQNLNFFSNDYDAKFDILYNFFQMSRRLLNLNFDSNKLATINQNKNNNFNFFSNTILQKFFMN